MAGAGDRDFGLVGWGEGIVKLEEAVCASGKGRVVKDRYVRVVGKRAGLA